MGQQGLRYMPWLLQVGGFTIFRNEDLGNVLPLWIKYTEDVREDPDVRPCLMSRERLQNETCMKRNGMLSLLCPAGGYRPQSADHRVCCGAMQAWNTSGDAYTTHAGLKPWIAEM